MGGGGGGGGLGGIAKTFLDPLDMTGSTANENALEAQEKAGNYANETLYGMYNKSRADAKPYMDAGSTAVKSLGANDFMKDWQQDPGYAFRLAEGQKAINNAASARGMGNSGATLKALTQYGQNVGAQEYQNVYDRNYNRLSGLANLGSNMASQGMQANQNYATARSGQQIDMGNARAGSIMGQNQRMMDLVKQGGSLMMGLPPMGGGPAADTQNTVQGGTRMGNTMKPF